MHQDLTDADTAVADPKPKASSTTVLVSRREAFNAAHQLRDDGMSDEENERVFGKCANLHGHNYVLEVVVAGEIQPATGYVMDLKQLSDVICRRVIQDVDHRNLNTDVPWLRGIHGRCALHLAGGLLQRRGEIHVACDKARSVRIRDVAGDQALAFRAQHQGLRLEVERVGEA